MKLNNRLTKISEFIDNNSFILDVGCDHALLDIFVSINKNVTCIASDINEKPLLKAKENILKYQAKNIFLEHADGIKGITNKVDTIVISGMGSILIKKIFSNDLHLLEHVNTIIVSPNNDEDIIRKYLTTKGYYIYDEEFVLDKKIIYQIIVFKKGYKHYCLKEILYGPILLLKKGSLYNKYYTSKYNSLVKIKKSLPRKLITKRLAINKKIRDLKTIL